MIDIYIIFITSLYFTHLEINIWSEAKVSFVLLWIPSGFEIFCEVWMPPGILQNTVIFGDITFSDLGYCQNRALWVKSVCQQ